MVHLFGWDPQAIHVPPEGNRLGQPYRRGAFRCLLCKVLMAFAEQWGLDCAGAVRAAPENAWLG